MHFFISNHRRALFAVALLFTAPIGAAPVDVNTASAAEIAAALNGIGDTRAAAIVDHRRLHGPFRSADELTAISGIGEKILQRIRADVQLGHKTHQPTATPPAVAQ